MTKDGRRIVSSGRTYDHRRPQHVATNQQQRTLEKLQRYMHVAVEEAWSGQR